MNTSAIKYDAVVFKKFDAALQAAIKTDFAGYEVKDGDRAISVIIELSAAPCQEFIKESRDKNALVMPAHLNAQSLFLSADGTVYWLIAIAQLECVVAIELTCQLRPARADQRVATENAVEFSDNAQSNKKIILGIIDHGCPIFHSALIQNNASRLLAIWDQDESPYFSPLNTCPQTMEYGRQILRPSINAWIEQSSSDFNGMDEDRAYAISNYPALRSRLTHGAMTSGLFVGPQKSPSVLEFSLNASLNAVDNALAVNVSDVVFVQLPRRGLLAPSTGATNRSILDGLRYILKCAGDDTEKIIVCIPYGNVQGPHDGSSVIERAIDAMILEAQEAGKTLEVVFPSGNTFNKPTLAKIVLPEKGVAQLAWNLPPDAETLMTAEIWMDKDNLPHSIEIALPITSEENISIDVASLKEEPKLINVGAITQGVVVLKDYGSNVLLMLQWIPPSLGSPAVLSFSQRWVLTFTASAAINKPIHCYLAWSGKNLGFEQRVRSSGWLALTDSVDITGHGSLLGTACGDKTYVIGACEKWGANRRAAYSGAGTPRGGTKTGLDCLAVSEESAWLPGIVCIGTRSGVITRMNGTSVAAPQAARVIANAGRLKIKVSPTNDPPKKDFTDVPGFGNSKFGAATEPILDDSP